MNTTTTALYSLVAFAFLAICDGLREHTGKLLFHSADNDPKDNTMTLIEVQRFFLLFDLNGDGDIMADEFVLAWKQHFGLTETEAQGILNAVDQFEPIGEITEIEITSAYNKMDQDNTGSVSLAEFLEFWDKLDVELLPKVKDLKPDTKHSPRLARRKMYRAIRSRRKL